MQRLLALFLLLCAAAATAIAQMPTDAPPANDLCARAVALSAGDVLPGQSNAGATLSLEFERPATVETTCIQTIENDVWYKFQAQPGVTMYEVVIVAQFCTTPAGLQALLIKSGDCTASHFSYRGCSNKISTDTIKLFLDAPEAGQDYLVWVDGYDGTVCEFEISLRARTALLPADYRFLRFDYAMGEPVAPRDDLHAAFANNATTLRWSADQSEGIALFIVEHLPDAPEVAADDRYARVVGFVDAQNFVGTGENSYAFTDYVTPYQQGRVYRYRIVAVDEAGSRRVSQTVEAKARLVEAFDVREVKAAAEPGKYVVRYINRKKGLDFDLSVTDLQGKVLKHMVLENEPQRDGNVTIDMSAFPPGEYIFVMSAGKEQFKRAFMHLPQ